MSALDAYVEQVAAHGHLNLRTELREAMRGVSDHGGFSILAEALGIPRTTSGGCGGLGVMKISTSGRYFTPAPTSWGAPAPSRSATTTDQRTRRVRVWAANPYRGHQRCR